MEPATFGPLDAAAVLAVHRPILLRRARRYSICADDADDALQRAIEILLARADTVDPNRVLPWMLTVVAREALAVRRKRVRELGPGVGDAVDLIAGVPCDSPGPVEAFEQRERVARAAHLLSRLKPQERRALALQAQGYSYREIGRITGWTQTKTNRCLAEGRARLRQLGAIT